MSVQLENEHFLLFHKRHATIIFYAWPSGEEHDNPHDHDITNIEPPKIYDVYNMT